MNKEQYSFRKKWTYSKRKNPKGYDGTEKTAHQLQEILPHVLTYMEQQFHDRGDLILAAWPELIGPQLAKMTQAVSFVDGVLLVKVKNSTLHSLLTQQDKPRVLAKLQKQFPNTVKKIVFRIG